MKTLWNKEAKYALAYGMSQELVEDALHEAENELLNAQENDEV